MCLLQLRIEHIFLALPSCVPFSPTTTPRSPHPLLPNRTIFPPPSKDRNTNTMTSLTSPDVSIPTTLHGHCHCRSIAFTATPLTPLTSYAECDCSICFRKAYRWTFISEASFKLENGDDANKKLKEYTFGAGGLVHTFCATCGCAVFAMQKEKGMVGVNLRMVDDIDFSKLSKQE
jgi:hypothetical protein